MPKLKTHIQFILELGEKNPDIEVLEEYHGSNEPLLVNDNRCNHSPWKCRPYLLLNGAGCPQCSKEKSIAKRTRTKDEYEAQLHSINPNIKILQYANSSSRVKAECLVCGKQWSPWAYGLLDGKGCPHCGAVEASKKRTNNLKTKTTNTYISEIAKINPNIRILGNYTTNKARIKVKCLVCGHEWNPVAASLLNGHGCPRCAKSGTSFMEQLLLVSFRSVLGETAVLSRDHSAIGMELDIYIPQYKLALEPGNWYLHKRNVERDKQKRDKCKEKNIRLITIYDKYLDPEAPFENDCIVYKDDLNKSDHRIIHDLIHQLLLIVGFDKSFSAEEWAKLEKKAYSQTKARNHTDFVDIMANIQPDIRVCGRYINSDMRIEVECKKCGFRWLGVPSSLLAGDGCRKCGRQISASKERKTQDDFVKQVSETNHYVEIIGEYRGRHYPIQTKCLICGQIWNPIASSLLRGSMHKPCSYKVLLKQGKSKPS